MAVLIAVLLSSLPGRPKQNRLVARIDRMIDAFIVEAFLATGCVWFAVAARRRSAVPRVSLPLAELPYRLRRQAYAVAALAREHAQRHAAGSPQAFTARETLRAYLPETVAAYLAVPPSLRHIRRAGGLSADEELSRQLDALRHGVEALREADAEVGAARMAENGAFLRERFGAPPPAAAAPPNAIALVCELMRALSVYGRRT